MTKKLALIALMLVLTSPAMAQTYSGEVWHSQTIQNPLESTASKFGFSSCMADMNLDGAPDLLVADPGLGLVWLFTGPDFTDYSVSSGDPGGPGGPGGGPGDPADGGGYADDVAPLVYQGAPAYMVSSKASGTVEIIGMSGLPMKTFQGPLGASFGFDLVGHDVDGDGVQDVFIGDPQNNRVYVYNGMNLNKPWMFLEGANADTGSFGHSMAGLDWNGDGFGDLAVSAPGNTHSDGTPLAGQVIVHLGPDLATTVLLEDGRPVLGDNGRFGMHVEGRGRFVSVGTPREDNQAHDSGRSRVFSSDSEKRYQSPSNEPESLFSFRTVVGNFTGDAHLDVAVMQLSNDKGFRGLFTYNSMRRNTMNFVPAIPGASHHWCQSAWAGQLVPGGYDVIICGDPVERRVVIYTQPGFASH